MKPIHAAAAAAVVAAGLAAPATYISVHAASTGSSIFHLAHARPGQMGNGPRWMRHLGGRRVEGWIAFLEVELNIGDDQRPQWEALADTLRQGAASMRELHENARAAHKDAAPKDAARQDGEERRHMSAVERLDRWETFAEAGLATVKSVNASFKPLYEAMTEEQKRLADGLLRRRHGR